MKSDHSIPSPLPGEKILFIRFSSLGDVLRATAAASAIKERFPDCPLTWLVCAEYAELVRSQPYVDDVIAWDRRSGPLSMPKLALCVRKRRFDWLVNVHGNDRSAFVSFFSGIPKRAGSHAHLKFTYDWPVGETLTSWKIHLGKKHPFLFVPPQELARGKERLAGLSGRRIAAVVGASKPSKRWPLENWLRFASMASEEGHSLILVGYGPEEEELSSQIASLLPKHRCLNLTGRLSFLEMASVFSACDAAAGGDTGPLHMAAILGLPCVGFFGPTDPESTHYDYNRFVALFSPCSHSGCGEKPCRNDRCLAGLDPVCVWEALRSFFEN